MSVRGNAKIDVRETQKKKNQDRKEQGGTEAIVKG